MKMRNVELYLQKNFDADFNFEDNRDNPIALSKLNKSLSASKVALVSSGGLYHHSEEAFDTDLNLGDTSFRTLHKDIKFEDVRIAHSHYDHKFALEDMNVVMPLKPLSLLKEEGVIGSVAEHHYSFCGFILDTKSFKENFQSIIETLKKDGVDVVILGPAWPICNQSVGLLGRALELAGFVTVTLNMFHELGDIVAAPRTLMTNNDYGAPFDKPHKLNEQKDLLKSCFGMLEMAPNESGVVIKNITI